MFVCLRDRENMDVRMYSPGTIQNNTLSFLH